MTTLWSIFAERRFYWGHYAWPRTRLRRSMSMACRPAGSIKMGVDGAPVCAPGPGSHVEALSRGDLSCGGGGLR